MVNSKKIPDELVQRKQWVLWKNVTRDGKSTKLPFQPNGQNAKSNDSSTWHNFETIALAVDNGYEGPGFVFSADDPYLGIDLDGCRDPETGYVSQWAKEIILKFNSYSEVSPSETGVKIFCAGEWPFEGGRKCTVDIASITGRQPGIEVYSQKRYFAVTGRKLANISGNLEQRQDAINWLITKFFQESSQPASEPPPIHTNNQIIERAAKYLAKIPPAISGQRGHDRTFQAACVLVLGFGLSQQDALALLSEWNQGCEPPWTQKELEHKVSDADKIVGERNYLRDAKQDDWNTISVPRYTPPSPPERKVLKVGTLEAASYAVVEEIASGKQTPLISTGLDELDAAIGGGYEQGEMIVIGARPSHGKSMVALQMCHAANAQQLPTLIVSEEMSSKALGKRVIQFASDVPAEDWHIQHELLRADLFEHFKGRADSFVVENCVTSNRVVEEIEKAAEERQVKVAFVDYAQLLQNEGKGRYEKTTNTSIALRSVGNRTGVTVVCLAQLSREIEKRPAFVPKMSDLRESGQFEQDADVILFLVWPHRISDKEDFDKYQIYVAKNRNRSITQNALTLKFQPSRQMLTKFMPANDSGWPSQDETNSYWEK